jgi:energy-coupling factor transporter ATP-binding protein EcfA2
MLLKCKEITFQYPNTDTCVLKNLTCLVPRAGFHALFGPSGVGKTTLAKIIAGELKVFSGEIIAREMHIVLYSYNLEGLPGWASVGDHLDAITPNSRSGRVFWASGVFEFPVCTAFPGTAKPHQPDTLPFAGF